MYQMVARRCWNVATQKGTSTIVNLMYNLTKNIGTHAKKIWERYYWSLPNDNTEQNNHKNDDKYWHICQRKPKRYIATPYVHHLKHNFYNINSKKLDQDCAYKWNSQNKMQVLAYCINWDTNQADVKKKLNKGNKPHKPKRIYWYGVSLVWSLL